MLIDTYECESLADAYEKLYYDIMNAKETNPRGMKTKELISPQILIKNPRNRYAYHELRKFSLKYALVESLLIFDKTNELKYFEKYNNNIGNYSDDGVHLYGSYGYRIAGSIDDIIKKLSADSDSRQIVLPILRIEDVTKETKDIPCTLNLQFIIRDNKLNMIVNMRSNDIIWGLPYDVFVFTTMQEIVANTLGIEMGWYLHRPTSLHLYEKHYDLFEKIGRNWKNVEMPNEYEIDSWKEVKDSYKHNFDFDFDYTFFNCLYAHFNQMINKVRI